jgi:ketosteroid isomerase-like protein
MPNDRVTGFGFIALVAVALSITACSPRPFDAEAEGAKLLRLDAQWADLATEGKDVEKIVSYWSDDATLTFPGQPVIKGKAALRAYVSESVKTPGFKIHWKSEKPVFSPDGRMAYMPGTDEVTVPGPHGALVTLHYRGVSIWRRDADAQWRCVFDISQPGAAARGRKRFSRIRQRQVKIFPAEGGCAMARS